MIRRELMKIIGMIALSMLVSVVGCSKLKKDTSFIGFLNERTIGRGGCACTYSEDPKDWEKTAVFVEDDRGARMVIYGGEVPVKLIDSNEKKVTLKKGATFYKKYQWDNVVINFDHEVVFICDESNPPEQRCNVMNYKIKMNAKGPKNAKEMTLNGECGC